jgi:lysophospholipase L1-like esterase
MEFVKSWAMRSGMAAVLVSLLIGAACSKAPTAPTPPPPPPPPVANPPSIACVAGIARSTTNAAGMVVNFEAPAITDGQGSVTVACTPESGATFPIGTTTVNCTATDSLNRTGTCSFAVAVTKLATLSKTRFLAFGDSITAGEVTFPISSLIGGQGLFTRQVVVASAAYPTVLAKTLQARYPSQEDSIIVANYGVGGEKVVQTRNRYFSALSTVRPDVVLLMEGANDIPLGEDGAASSAAQEISVWVAEAKARGMRVFLATPVPGRPGGNRTIQTVLLVDYANRMRRVAEQQGVTLVDLYSLLLPDVQRYIGVDGLHPNEAGYARIAELFGQEIIRQFEVR